MTLEEQLEIIQAAVDGKRVQSRPRRTPNRPFLSVGNDGHAFDFERMEYRIVKTGRERLMEDMRMLDNESCTEKSCYKYAAMEMLRNVVAGKYGELHDA